MAKATIEYGFEIRDLSIFSIVEIEGGKFSNKKGIIVIEHDSGLMIWTWKNFEGSVGANGII